MYLKILFYSIGCSLDWGRGFEPFKFHSYQRPAIATATSPRRGSAVCIGRRRHLKRLTCLATNTSISESILAHFPCRFAPKLRLAYSFLILSNLVTSHRIRLSVLVSATFVFTSSLLFNAQHSTPRQFFKIFLFHPLMALTFFLIVRLSCRRFLPLHPVTRRVLLATSSTILPFSRTTDRPTRLTRLNTRIFLLRKMNSSSGDKTFVRPVCIDATRARFAPHTIKKPTNGDEPKGGSWRSVTPLPTRKY